jgi:hypothetical protein
MLRMKKQIGTIARYAVDVEAYCKRPAFSRVLKPRFPTAALSPAGITVGSACARLTVAYAVSKRFYNGGTPQGTYLID